MKPINLRVREETLELADALVAQRGLNRAALLREALEVGMFVVAASGPPAEHNPADLYRDSSLAAPTLQNLAHYTPATHACLCSSSESCIVVSSYPPSDHFHAPLIVSGASSEA